MPVRLISASISISILIFCCNCSSSVFSCSTFANEFVTTIVSGDIRRILTSASRFLLVTIGNTISKFFIPAFASSKALIGLVIEIPIIV